MIKPFIKGEATAAQPVLSEGPQQNVNPLEVQNSDLVRCISASPVEGVIRPNAKSVDVSVALNMNMMIAYRQDLECELVIQLSANKVTSTQKLPVHAELVPSLMRMPLELLAGLKDKALADQKDESN